MSDETLERRAAIAAVAIAVAVVCGMLLVLPARPPGFDEAKYLGIGLNVLAGNGPRTAFGVFFEPHSPLWPVIVAAPQVWFGIDAFAWAHVLNVAATAVVMILAAALGWGIRPAAGALAAIGFLGSAYLFGIARRTGLDMPAAALSLAFLVAGFAAVRRGSTPLGIVAGVIFAVGFLVKEIVVPLAPVPLLAGVAWRRPSGEILRVGSAMLLTVAVGTSWWWLVFAAETGRVYRLGTPAWTLLPGALAVAGASVVGLAWDRPAFAGLRDRLDRVAPTWARPLALAWALAVAWALALALFFARAWELRGAPLVDAGQLTFYLGRWIQDLAPFLVLGGIGTAVELARRRRAASPRDRPVVHLLLALACSAPLVLLVVGVGEHPRHYIAQLGILSAIGAAGWLSLVEAAATRPGRATIGALATASSAAAVLLAVAFLGPRGMLAVAAAAGAFALAGVVLLAGARLLWPRLRIHVTAGRVAAGVVGLAVVTGSVGAGAWHLGRPVAPVDAAKAETLRQVTTWLRDEVPPGSTVAFNGTLGHEAAVAVQYRVRTVMVREDESVVFDPSAPLGVRSLGGQPADDWVALFSSPNIGSTFYGYRATELVEALHRDAVDVWVVGGLTGPTTPLVIDRALTAEHGFRRLATMATSFGDGAVEANVYAIDRERLAFGPEVYVSAMALERLLDQLEADPAADPSIAGALAERAVVVPAGPVADALRERLAAIARR